MALNVTCFKPFIEVGLARSTKANASYLRLESLARKRWPPAAPHQWWRRSHTNSVNTEKAMESSKIAERPFRDPWPRMPAQTEAMTIKQFRAKFDHLKLGQEVKSTHMHVRGRIQSIRRAGRHLLFIDLDQDKQRLQCMCNSKIMDEQAPTGDSEASSDGLRRGDVISIRGYPQRTQRGELTIMATEIPKLLSKSNNDLPGTNPGEEARSRHRTLEFWFNDKAFHTVRLRSKLVAYIRQYLFAREFTEVHTPILAARAGGAIARPFETRASAFSDRSLSLRIAPELWLKKLVLGGFDRIFEIGPCFRNEGIDLDHNPEFWTCEFYMAYATLENLIQMSEEMLSGLAKMLKADIESDLPSLCGAERTFSPPFQRLDFIPELENCIGFKLPDLESHDAEEALLQAMSEHNLGIPAVKTLPRLLDKLSARFIEPQCDHPTWIINQPECLSPLSKSLPHPLLPHQRVAARAELFINSQELINTYEEENSPVEQRRKFETQLRFKDTEAGDSNGIDESYLEALDWGLPPTAGWGCGIDRMCMLFAGAKRIADVMPFGTLQNVTAQH